MSSDSTANTNLDSLKFQLEKDRFEWQKQNDSYQSRFFSRHLGVIVSALISLATLVFSATQIYSSIASKSIEQDENKRKNEREWQIKIAELFLANKESMTSEDPKEILFIRNIALSTFPSDVVKPVFTQLADLTDRTDIRSIWLDGVRIAAVELKVTADTGTSSSSRFTAENLVKLFPFWEKADVEQNLPLVEVSLKKRELLQEKYLRVFLAILAHETADLGFKPLKEFGTDAELEKRYGGREDLGNTQVGDGARYRGRGYVQLVGRSNYERFGKLLGVNLVDNPELAMEPGIAAEIAAEYYLTLKDRFDQALSENDMKAVWRRYNGGLNGLDDFLRKYEVLGNIK